MKPFLQELRERRFYVLLFAVLFSLLGRFLPNAYYQYFDRTEYYSIEIPQIEDKNLKVCDDVNYFYKRIAKQNLQFAVRVDLILFESGRPEHQIHTWVAEPNNAEAGELIIENKRELPCDMPEGFYKLRFFYNYDVYGVEKVYTKDSELFQVSKD